MTRSSQRPAVPVGRRRPSGEFENLYTELWSPEADILETDSAYIVEVELPGVWHKDVDVSLNGNELVVTGAVKEREREGLFRRRTRKVGEFEFRATLPGPLREDEVEASLAYGVLRVYVPKAESAKTRKIPVSDSSDAPT
ncbi:Hsp20/alpha crystallin family protein [Mycolicibacterium iranicum]|uniref:Hsp20/alpha crystallin family protein n=1 Tax=Mycolicibacterium iranicum TaxID=912594 RepID=UPI0007D92236|nr:Hsp20/alpha crystallin family protein [Mycolicibacterium iranicum]